MSGKQVLVRPQFQIIPQTLEDAWRLSKAIASSDLAPKDYKGKPENCLIAMQLGGELGLSPMAAIQNIAVINGRPALWGDAVIGLVLDDPNCEWIEEKFDDPNNPQVAFCTVKRVGHPPHTRQFSMKDAAKANLLGKDSWKGYPADMLKNRARKALWDKFADRLKGIALREEMMDIGVEPSHVVVKESGPSQGDKILDKIGATSQVAPEPIETEACTQSSPEVAPQPEEKSEPEQKSDEIKEPTPLTYDPSKQGTSKLWSIMVEWLGDTRSVNAFVKELMGDKVKKGSDFNALKEEDRKILWDALQTKPRQAKLI